MKALLATYVHLHPCICKAYVDLKVKSETTDDEYKVIESIVNALTSVTLARRDTTLISAKGVLHFLFEELDKQKT